MPETTTPVLRPPAPWLWTEDHKRIQLSVNTKDFLTAIGIVNEIARIAEEVMHHPDLHIEGWNHLRIETYTHTEGAVTQRDIELAHRIHDLLKDKHVL